jgi:hypothetical protein
MAGRATAIPFLVTVVVVDRVALHEDIMMTHTAFHAEKPIVTTHPVNGGDPLICTITPTADPTLVRPWDQEHKTKSRWCAPISRTSPASSTPAARRWRRAYDRRMGLREWARRLRRREDASALRRAEATRTETEAERAASSGGIEGMAADEAAREHGGEPPFDESEQPPR